MTENQGVESIEIERKYDVLPGVSLPPAPVFAEAGLEASQPVEYHLIAKYFDTPDRALARLGIAVRSRAGGKDAGWHLKRKGDGGNREIGWPESAEMPAALVAQIRELIGQEAASRLRPIAELRTRRIVVVLSAPGAGGVVELADDEIRAFDRQAPDPAGEIRRAWHEWESEIINDADPTWLDRVEPVLLGGGGAPSPSSAKIARATGQLAAVARSKGADASVIEMLEAIDLADQAAARRLDA
ncbi:CYTH domain-containing protein [Leucobacter sp. CSA2]|uniref:CYTH domain-containing protein n=1 Tax=Leucobacter edaphi TaxID=2796472 RepID=A0A934Q966_9MICO|nr:CYTH domain-containing protein [Leucobacter edaphi]